jgi:diacylglycerol kinase (ATP)
LVFVQRPQFVGQLLMCVLRRFIQQTMKVKVILNPYANRWRAKSRADAILDACHLAGLEADMAFIPAPGLGAQEAMRASDDGYDAVVAAGGDGTVHEVVNGLIAASGDGPTKPLGVMPVGTGNDFNDMSGLPRDLLGAAKIVAAGQTRQVDAGRITVDDRVHYFDNNCALAMEPVVTIENVKMTRLSGNIRYVAAVIKSLAQLNAWQMRVTWDDGAYEGPIILLSVCNSPRTGGLFRMAPEAKMDDGLFDFVYAPDLPMAQVIKLLPRLVRGTHIKHEQISYGRTRALTAECEAGSPIHADGEVLSESATRFTYEILPNKITLLAG